MGNIQYVAVDGTVTTGTYTPDVRAVTTDEVNAERDRRILKGRSFMGVYVTGSATDARNLMSLALAAQMRIASGDTTTITVFRDGNNVDHELAPREILTLWTLSAGFVENLYKKSWELKAINPIPLEYANDDYWD
jgi:hypothetical protein